MVIYQNFRWLCISTFKNKVFNLSYQIIYEYAKECGR